MRVTPFTATAACCFLFASISAGQQVQTGEQPANPTQEIAKEQPEGPALEIGPARLRIGGYLGVMGIYRSTNSGGGTGTSFASIPYEDKVQGHVSETRLSAQSSRISLRVDAEFPEPETRFRKLSGYFEMDFGGRRRAPWQSRVRALAFVSARDSLRFSTAERSSWLSGRPSH